MYLINSIPLNKHAYQYQFPVDIYFENEKLNLLSIIEISEGCVAFHVVHITNLLNTVLQQIVLVLFFIHLD